MSVFRKSSKMEGSSRVPCGRSSAFLAHDEQIALENTSPKQLCQLVTLLFTFYILYFTLHILLCVCAQQFSWKILWHKCFHFSSCLSHLIRHQTDKRVVCGYLNWNTCNSLFTHFPSPQCLYKVCTNVHSYHCDLEGN